MGKRTIFVNILNKTLHPYTRQPFVMLWLGSKAKTVLAKQLCGIHVVFIQKYINGHSSI